MRRLFYPWFTCTILIGTGLACTDPRPILLPTDTADDTASSDTGTPEAVTECVVQPDGCDLVLTANDEGQIILQGSGYWADDGLDHSGETICIPAGTYTHMNFSGLTGTEDQAVRIQNCGEGQVIVDAGGENAALSASGTRFLHFAGTGNPNVDYGFVLMNSGAGRTVVDMREGVTDIEIEGFEVTGPSYAGISIRNYPYCDADLARDVFIQRNTVLHHNYIHDVSGEGLYIGPSHYDQDYSPTSTEDCAPGYPEAGLSGVEIAYNLVENTGRDGIQVGAALDGLEIHHNIIRSYALLEDYGHVGGIQLNPGTVGRVYANWIQSQDGNMSDNAFQIAGGDTGPLYIYNNVIVGSKVPVLALVRIGGPDHSGHLLNNTIHGRADGGRSLYIFCKEDFEQPFTVTNNLFAGNERIGYPIWTDDKGQVYSKIVDAHSENCPINGTAYGNGLDSELKIPGNFYDPDPNIAGFVDWEQHDYHLTDESPAIGAGEDLSAIFTDDFDGEDRGLEPFDLGAYRH